MAIVSISDAVNFFDCGNSRVTRHLIDDAVEMFYKSDKERLRIHLENNNGDTTTRGNILYGEFDDRHVINIFIDTIRDHFSKRMRMGGNFVCDDIDVAIMSVLVHEIQHGNQALMFKREEKFWSGKYYMKPCEVDARRFVDDNSDVIYSMLGLQVKRTEHDRQIEDADAVYTIVDIFSELDSVSVDDIRRELVSHGLNNPAKFSEIITILGTRGTSVTRDYRDVA